MKSRIKREKFFVVNSGVVLALIIQNFLRTTMGFGELYDFQITSQREKVRGSEAFRQMNGKFNFCHDNNHKTSMLFSILLRKGEESRWMLQQFISVSFHTGKGWKEVDLRRPSLAGLQEMRGRIRKK